MVLAQVAAEVAVVFIGGIATLYFAVWGYQNTTYSITKDAAIWIENQTITPVNGSFRSASRSGQHRILLGVGMTAAE